MSDGDSKRRARRAAARYEDPLHYYRRALTIRGLLTDAENARVRKRIDKRLAEGARSG